jgi:hypothetical protein
VIGEDFRSGVPGPIDLIVDPVGGQERFTESLRSLAPEGCIVVVGFTAGEIPTVKVNRLLLGNTDVRRCAFGVLAFNPAALANAVARLSDLIAAGSVRAVIGSVYPLERVKEALHDLDNRHRSRFRRSVPPFGSTSASALRAQSARCTTYGRATIETWHVADRFDAATHRVGLREKRFRAGTARRAWRRSRARSLSRASAWSITGQLSAA